MSKTVKAVVITLSALFVAGVFLFGGLVTLVAVCAVADGASQQQVEQTQLTQGDRDDRAQAAFNDSLENMGGANVSYGD